VDSSRKKGIAIANTAALSAQEEKRAGRTILRVFSVQPIFAGKWREQRARDRGGRDIKIRAANLFGRNARAAPIMIQGFVCAPGTEGQGLGTNSARWPSSVRQDDCIVFAPVGLPAGISRP